MIGFEEALQRLLALVPPLGSETLGIEQCYGRFLAGDILAKRTQPAADLSAMDGYAVRFGDLGNALKIIGESAAGKPFEVTLCPNQAVRIFTGAHIPKGADTVLIQEDAEADKIILRKSGEGPKTLGAHVRRAGTDFKTNDILLSKGKVLNAGAIATAVMGGYGALNVVRIPKIAIIGSGDELVAPGTVTTDAQIPSSNNMMLAAMLNPLGCIVANAGTAADSVAALQNKFAQCSDADIIVTSGGASVGDHDLVQEALRNVGAEIDFWRVAVKPGKPLIAGRLGKSIVLGLPGNPGSAYVTAYLFLLPLVRHLAGSSHPRQQTLSAITQNDLPATGMRTEFLRAVVGENGIAPVTKQDSGVTQSLAAANALLIRPAFADKVPAGNMVTYYPL